jgi:hypothetical protein
MKSTLVNNVDYRARAKINIAIFATLALIIYFVSLLPENKDTPAKPPFVISELWGNLLININDRELSNDECEALIVKNLSRQNIDKISVFDTRGQVCFSNLKRDSGIVQLR